MQSQSCSQTITRHHSTAKTKQISRALHSASLRLRCLPNAQAQPTIPPSPTTRKCSAEYSPALAHLNPTTRITNKPLNSARQSLHSLHFVTLSFRSVGKRCSAEKNPHRRCSPLRSVCATYPTTQPRPTPAKAPIRRRLRKSNHAGSLSAFAHNQSDTHNSTGASLRLRNLPNAQARSPANAVPSTALHLLTSTRPPRPQANRSTAPANRSIRFTSLRFHYAQSVSAVQRKRTRIGAALRFAPFAQPAGRADQLTQPCTAMPSLASRVLIHPIHPQQSQSNHQTRTAGSKADYRLRPGTAHPKNHAPRRT